jgi:hypothetical protein
LRDVQRLPPDQRAALVLFEVGDHSHQDIAAVLGVRREKVKALVFQARETLMGWRTARETPCGHVREQLATLNAAARWGAARCAATSSNARAVPNSRPPCAASAPPWRSRCRSRPPVGLRAAVLGSCLGGSGAARWPGRRARSDGGLAAKVLVVAALVGGAGAAATLCAASHSPAPEATVAPAPRGGRADPRARTRRTRRPRVTAARAAPTVKRAPRNAKTRRTGASAVRHVPARGPTPPAAGRRHGAPRPAS